MVHNKTIAKAEDNSLSQGWLLSTIGDICEVNPRKSPADTLPPDASVTFVPMSAVDAAMGVILSPEIRTYLDVRKGYTEFRETDVLMAKITPCMENGKAAIASGLTNGIGFGSTEFHVLRSIGVAKPGYVFHYIRQESFREEAKAHMSGTAGQLRVPPDFLKASSIPLPPLAEQERIVAKLEELLPRVNNARERLARIPVLLKRFRQAVLAAACSGRLTADWRERHRNGSRSSNGFEDDNLFDESKELPQEWKNSTVDDVCSVIVDCPHSTPKWTDSGEICLRTTNFRPGSLDLSTVRYVSTKTYRERIARLEPTPGDIVYSREGGILGIACLMPERTRACLGQRMMLMRTDSRLCLPTFLMNVLNSPVALKRVSELTGGTASPHLNVGDVKRFPIPLPPLDEQTEVIARVAYLLNLADKLEQRVGLATRRADKLTQSILARAFRGELVPGEAELARAEGRSYESAAELLARIRRASDSCAARQPRKHSRTAR